MAQCWLRCEKYSPQMGVDHVPLQNFTMDLVLTLCIWLQKAWRFSFARGTRDSLTTWRSLAPPPNRFLPRTTSWHSSLLHRQAKTDRLDWLARTPLAHHFDFVWGQGSAQWCRSYLELDDNRKNMILFCDATESYYTAWTSSLERTC